MTACTPQIYFNFKTNEMMVVRLVEQLTNDAKFEGSNAAPSKNDEKGPL
jgi:hypothetical protein